MALSEVQKNVFFNGLLSVIGFLKGFYLPSVYARLALYLKLFTSGKDLSGGA